MSESGQASSWHVHYVCCMKGLTKPTLLVQKPVREAAPSSGLPSSWATCKHIEMRVRCSAIHSYGRGLARQAGARGRVHGGRLGDVIRAKITGLLTRNLPQQMVSRRPGANLGTKPFPTGNPNIEPGARKDWVPGRHTDHSWCDSACIQWLLKPGTPSMQRVVCQPPVTPQSPTTNVPISQRRKKDYWRKAISVCRWTQRLNPITWYWSLMDPRSVSSRWSKE